MAHSLLPPTLELSAASCSRTWQTKVQHSGPIFLFTAGMEHTGHHLFDAARQRLGVIVANATSQEVYFSDASHLDGCAPATAALAKAFREDAAAAAAAAASDAPPNAVHLSASAPPIWVPCGSYPSVWGREPHLEGSPDVHALARAAESASVDLRMLLMLRPTAEIVYDFRGPRLRSLLTACAALQQQLLALDPSFFHCFMYADAANATAVSRAAAFTGVPLTSEVLQALEHSAHASHGDGWLPSHDHSGDEASIRGLAGAEADLWQQLVSCHQGVADLCGPGAPALR